MEGMREMLKGSLGRTLGTLSAFDRLCAAWPVACGAALARKAEPVSFEDGILRMEVADVRWMEQMLGMRTRLEHELAQIGEVKLRGIHFELMGATRRPSAKRPSKGKNKQ